MRPAVAGQVKINKAETTAQVLEGGQHDFETLRTF